MQNELDAANAELFLEMSQRLKQQKLYNFESSYCAPVSHFESSNGLVELDEMLQLMFSKLFKDTNRFEELPKK